MDNYRIDTMIKSIGGETYFKYKTYF